VLLHGYGGSSALFYPIHKALAKRFNLILVDIIGMGGSSRPTDFRSEKLGPQQSIDYFVNYLERWRQQMTKLLNKEAQARSKAIEELSGSPLEGSGEFTQFILAGHSLGGYIIGNYALKHHRHMKKLIFLSPIGLKAKETEEEWEGLEEKFQELQEFPFWFKQLTRWTWKNQVSPFGVNRLLGQRQSYSMVKNYIEKKWMPSGTVAQESVDTIADYLY